MIVERHSRVPRKSVASELSQRVALHTQARRNSPVAPEVRSHILEVAKERIMLGDTLKQIASDHSIGESTLEMWLHALGDEYLTLRQAWIDQMLREAGELIKQSRSPLALARARELIRRAQWYAERRDRNRYGDDRQATVGVSPVFSVTIVQERGAPATKDCAVIIENVESKT